MSSLNAVGIDVGATNSVMAWVNAAGHSEVLSDREGNRFIPSVLFFDDAKVSVGEEARLRSAGKPDYLARLAKLSLGRRVHDLAIRGEKFPPEVIQACLLHRLRCELDRRLGEGEHRVVLTVPAFFGEVQRKAAADAAEIAGLPLLDLLNEPAAAALAFGEHTGYLSPSGVPQQRLLALVYNLNGFTFETTLLEISPGGVNTLAVDGDLALGGRLWDERLADCVAEQFIRKYGLDPRDDLPTREQLLSRAERAKHALTLRPTAHFSLECQGRTLEVKVTREQFVHATADLVDRTVEVAEQMLATAGIGWPLVDRILLTGGATQIPMIRQGLYQAAGREPDFTVHPNEAVARGAALYAQSLLKKGARGVRTSQFEVTNVATRSLGLQGVDAKTGRKINKVLIHRGTPLPATATEKFLIHPGKTKEVVITVLEGDHRDASQCEVAAKAIIKDLPADLADEWPVAVTYEYTSSGRLRVEARLCYTDRAVKLDLQQAVGMSQAQRERWKSIVTAEAPFQEFQAELHRRRSTPIAYATSARDEEPTPPEPAGESLLDRARHWLQRLGPGNHGPFHGASASRSASV